ncbi:hypothetical protein FGO68_gene8249 [Halteria grandinella]|uniref:Uncharacterized protein n=1 Tax=Halteria grandinella TaxID=5974 RepID=A0A8J8P8D9_HALGN|nr:hypothetical protein FGO68_gene8249 [Halteria grandinella]
MQTLFQLSVLQMKKHWSINAKQLKKYKRLNQICKSDRYSFYPQGANRPILSKIYKQIRHQHRVRGITCKTNLIQSRICKNFPNILVITQEIRKTCISQSPQKYKSQLFSPSDNFIHAHTNSQQQ